MKNWMAVVLAVLLAGYFSTAKADIINGGFEAGTFTGWTTTGQVYITSVGTDPRTNNNLSLVGVGTHSAKVGDEDAYERVGSASSSISQSWTVGGTWQDLYFAWAAVGLVPNNGVFHSNTQTPWFQIKVDWTHGATTTNLVSTEAYTGNLGSINPGWIAGATQTQFGPLGQSEAGVWYYRPWETFHLNLAGAGVALGDTLTVALTARDCTLGGHASYAYLDGFGSNRPVLTPEPRAWELLAVMLAGVGGLVRILRRRMA